MGTGWMVCLTPRREPPGLQRSIQNLQPYEDFANSIHYYSNSVMTATPRGSAQVDLI